MIAPACTFSRIVSSAISFHCSGTDLVRTLLFPLWLQQSKDGLLASAPPRYWRSLRSLCMLRAAPPLQVSSTRPDFVLQLTARTGHVVPSIPANERRCAASHQDLLKPLDVPFRGWTVRNLRRGV